MAEDMEIGSIEIVTPGEANIDELYNIISEYKNFYALKEKDKAYLATVEEEDVSGNPRKFIIVELMPSKIIVIYTIAPDESPSVRKLEVFSKILPMLEPIIPKYRLPISALLSILDSALSQFLKKFTRDVRDVLIDNDRLREKVKELQSHLEMERKNVRELTTKLYEVNSLLSEAKMKLKKYETPSDEVLKQLVVEWLKEHDGEIDLETFSKVKNVPIARVEEILTRLIEEKVIKPL